MSGSHSFRCDFGPPFNHHLRVGPANYVERMHLSGGTARFRCSSRQLDYHQVPI
ncbi:hypothetical protein C8Q74DRAFT_1304705 [Fomes fomentarius]|nr:hypothetical protein C8Q74DRAFT_1304705 [Fomes fomentarius]